ncbi:ferredoxin [Anopheles sinensis]|uniref:Ferredoxin n=1 Tax=Anopheles sinensis TaxID=74873 RepID=A0A084WCM1_ANOSI|nr:ferredoxin [Anopheles sinensis]
MYLIMVIPALPTSSTSYRSGAYLQYEDVKLVRISEASGRCIQKPTHPKTDSNRLVNELNRISAERWF